MKPQSGDTDRSGKWFIQPLDLARTTPILINMTLNYIFSGHLHGRQPISKRAHPASVARRAIDAWESGRVWFPRNPNLTSCPLGS